MVLHSGITPDKFIDHIYMAPGTEVRSTIYKANILPSVQSLGPPAIEKIHKTNALF